VGLDSPVEPVGPHRRSRSSVDTPKWRPGLYRSRARCHRSPDAFSHYIWSLLVSDRQRTGGDRMGTGRVKGLFKPNNTPIEAATGPTGGFLVCSALHRGAHPSSCLKGEFSKIATSSNPQVTTKIAHLGDVQSVARLIRCPRRYREYGYPLGGVGASNFVP
jgi:hypothetical protein